MNTSQVLTASLAHLDAGGQYALSLAPHIPPLEFLNGSVTRFTSNDGQQHCYVAETADEVILSFQGVELNEEQAQTPNHWLEQLIAEAVERPGFPGRVHAHFYDTAIELNQTTGSRHQPDQHCVGFIDEVRYRLAIEKKPFYITGYGQGAALAPLAAWMFYQQGIEANHIVLFEAPRCGDRCFSDVFNKTFPQAIRYEYKNDIVPHIPPSQLELNTILHAEQNVISDEIKDRLKQQIQWNYKSVGVLNYIDQNGDIVSNCDLLKVSRLAQLTLHANDWFSDHNPVDHLLSHLGEEPEAAYSASSADAQKMGSGLLSVS